MKAYGTVHKYGDNVDTDVIIPARYLNSSDPVELSKHCMEDIDKEFVNQVKAGDIIVAKKNFGCGSSREHAPIAIKASGISCVIADTFARIFYRNSINIGLPIIECPEAAEGIENGDEVEIDFDSGIIFDKTKNTQYKGQAFPPFMQEIIKSEGLINYVNKKKKCNQIVLKCAGLPAKRIPAERQEKNLKCNLAVIKGDGIGPEIVTEAMKVLDKIGEVYHHTFDYEQILMGGCSIDATGVPLTDEAVNIAKSKDAVLLGSIGGNTSTSPWYQLPPNLRPEAGLLKNQKRTWLICEPETGNAV